jgi:hypothetical protein
MIKKPTTLILGAGASAPFGFPTGYELLLNKVLLLDNTSNPVFESFPQVHVEAFKNALSKSGKKSVDSFLEHRPEFVPIGKSAIRDCHLCPTVFWLSKFQHYIP